MTLVLSITIKIALLTLGALVATALLHRRSAAVRHWILATTLFCSVCVPAVELLMPAWTIPLPAAWQTSSATSSLRFVSGSTSVENARPAVGDATFASPVNAIPSLTTILVTIWIAGTAIGITVLAAGLWRLRRLALDAQPVSSGPWREAADRIALRYGVRRKVRLLRCHHPTMLATWGVVSPAIILPAGAEDWGQDRVDAVLHHELAHILRADWVVAITAHMLRAIYWINPLLWIACRQLRLEGERACDDIVLTAGISGAEYATHLLDVARESARPRHPWSPAIAIAHHSMLEGRIRAMLNARVNREPLSGFSRAATVVVLAALTGSVGVISLSGSTTTPAAIAVSPATPDVSPLPVALPQAQRTEPRPARATSAAAQAQAPGGTVEGVLYDQFGGLLPGAAVKLTQLGAGNAHTGVTDRGGSFVFKGLAAGDYELVTDLPGFTSVKNVVRSEPGTTVRRHITLPLGTVQETINVTCSSSDGSTSRPTAPAGSATPGAAPRQSTPGPRGSEPKIPSTFTGGIGGQIKAPTKTSHTNPICPAGVAPQGTVVRLAGRIGIDGLFTDLRDVGTDAPAAFVASAMEAARRWEFTPTLLNGAPIEANINVTVSYTWSN